MATHYEVEMVSILRKLFVADHFGNSAVLHITKLSSSKIFSTSHPSKLIKDLEVMLISNNVSQFSADDVCYSGSIEQLALALYTNGSCTSSIPIILVPLYKHYSSLQPPKVASLKLALEHIQTSIIRKNQRRDQEYETIRPQIKKHAASLLIECEKIRKRLHNNDLSLEASWALLKQLETVELHYDEARLQSIPPSSKIKLVGNGFKIGLSAIWLEKMVCPFSCTTVRHDSSMSTPDKGSPKVKGKSPLINVKTSAPKIYLHIGSKSTNYGVVSYRSENIYLRGERGSERSWGGKGGTERNGRNGTS